MTTTINQLSDNKKYLDNFKDKNNSNKYNFSRQLGGFDYPSYLDDRAKMTEVEQLYYDVNNKVLVRHIKKLRKLMSDSQNTFYSDDMLRNIILKDTHDKAIQDKNIVETFGFSDVKFIDGDRAVEFNIVLEVKDNPEDSEEDYRYVIEILKLAINKIILVNRERYNSVIRGEYLDYILKQYIALDDK